MLESEIGAAKLCIPIDMHKSYRASKAPISSLVLFLSMMLLCSCDDGKPEVIESQRFDSPDGNFQITDEIVHNGLGMGAGAVFEEIHLAKSNATFTHDDNDTSSILYYEAVPTDTESRRARFRWLNSLTVVVSYPEDVTLTKRVNNISGIAIQYEKFELPQKDRKAQ